MKHFTALVKADNGAYAKIACLVKRSNVQKDRFGNSFYTYTAKVEYADYTFEDVNNKPVSINASTDLYCKNIIEKLLLKWLDISGICIEHISETTF